MTQPVWLKKWEKKRVYLFIAEGELVTYAPRIGISTIAWEPREKPTALLYGCPSVSPALVSLAEDFDLEVHHSPCGRPDVHEKEHVIIKMHCCSVRRKYFANPVEIDAWHKEESINLYVLVEAEQIEILPENG